MRIVQDYIRKILRQGAKVGPKTIEAQAIPVPVLWLLGKTGAGKSSLIRALTGEAEVGEGFAPCTRTAMAYDYPPERPVMRFLDTRGVSESGYDPQEDLAAAEKGSHALVVLARLDDPVQAEVAAVLSDLRRRRSAPAGACRFIPVLISPEISRPRERARIRTQERL